MTQVQIPLVAHFISWPHGFSLLRAFYYSLLYLDVTLRLALWVKFSADDILKYFSYFSQKTGFDISCKLSLKETICMKCQILFSGKNKKNNIILSSAENAQRVLKVKQCWKRQKIPNHHHGISALFFGLFLVLLQGILNSLFALVVWLQLQRVLEFQVKQLHWIEDIALSW